MKTFLITLFSFALATNGFSQTAALPDSTSVKTKTPSEQNIGIRCVTTISADLSPLFIVDGVLMGSDSSFLNELDPNDITDIQVLKKPIGFGCFGRASENGVVLISTKHVNQLPFVKERQYPFKVYKICNTNWTTLQDVYNAIQSKVPNVQIGPNTSLFDCRI